MGAEVAVDVGKIILVAVGAIMEVGVNEGAVVGVGWVPLLLPLLCSASRYSP